MELNYDKIADALSIRFCGEIIVESEEICPGTIIDYDDKGKIVAIEILNFSHRSLNLNELIVLSVEEIVPLLIQC